MLEDTLARLHIDNKTVWLYLLAELKYIDRQEVEALTRKLPQNGNGTGELYQSLFDLCTGEPQPITRTPRDRFLKHVCFSYNPPIKEFSPISSKNGQFLWLVDILAQGFQPFYDLYALESFGEANSDRRLSKETDDPQQIWEEKFTLTERGRQHAWVLGLIVQNNIYPRLQKGDLILTGHDSSRVISTRVIST